MNYTTTWKSLDTFLGICLLVQGIIIDLTSACHFFNHLIS